MKKVDVSKMKKEFLKYSNGEDFPESLFEWQNYDGHTKQVFLWVEGDWNDAIRYKLRDFLRNFHKSITISRMISIYKE